MRKSRQLFSKKKKENTFGPKCFLVFFFQLSVFSFQFLVSSKKQKTKKNAGISGRLFSTVSKKKTHTHTLEKRGIRMVACVRARARGRLGMWAWRCLGAMCGQCI